ncbi:hypothetical protein QEH53_00050 [Pelagicoccus sp. SDUM812002]|nr:hypothetical protein [Pelagicoccus sp. SDUM812002]
MDSNVQIERLKKLLREEVASFCRQDNNSWRKSVSETISEIRERKWNAVFFGGTLRSLLISRLNENKPGRPRDIDIVMCGASLEDMRSSFKPYISRQTRFGGLQLKRVNWQFDVWPLKETFALRERKMEFPKFSDLPSTTFFNVEAIAVEIWPKPGRSRRIFSGDDQFFTGITTRTIEINHEANPYPQLCVVRALVMAAKLQWKIGPRLLVYLGEHGDTMSPKDFEAIQEKHYERILWPGSYFEKAMKEVRRAIERRETEAVELSLPGQLTLWPEDEVYHQRIHLRTLKAATSSKNKK